MFVYSYSEYGPPSVVRKVEQPTPKPAANEVLVKICATTVSTADWRMRSLAMPQGLAWAARPAFGLFGPRKPVLGNEFSGIVIQTGSDVTRFKVDDEVIGFPGVDLGAHAQFITMPADGKLTLKPKNISHIHAAALPFGATTAYDFLINKGQLRTGEKILINGASGSTGSACVQIAKHFGAHVTGICSQKNAKRVREIGADSIIDYQTTDFSAQPDRYDIIVDTVGNAPWSRTRHALKPNGRMVLVAGKASDMFFGSLKARFTGQRLIAGVAQENLDILETVVKLADDGAMRPLIDQCFDLDQMVAAHQRVECGRKVGNVVVIVDQDLARQQI